MPFNTGAAGTLSPGVYYADTSTPMSIANITAAIATSSANAVEDVKLNTAYSVADSVERDSIYPAPVQGNAVFNNERGWEERYFELYNVSTMPGGASPSGWYPANQRLVFAATATRSAATGTAYVAGTAGFLYTEVLDPLSFGSGADQIVPNIPGWYRVSVDANFGSNATGTRNIRILKNAANTTGGRITITPSGVNYSGASVTTLVSMNGTSDYLTAEVMQSSGSALTADVAVRVEWVGVKNTA